MKVCFLFFRYILLYIFFDWSTPETFNISYGKRLHLPIDIAAEVLLEFYGRLLPSSAR